MRKHRLGKQLLIALCAGLLVFLAGCRPSPVLEQIIYEQNHEIDKDLETKSIENDQENEDQDEDLPSKKTVDEAKQTKDQEYKMAIAGDVDTDPDAPLDAVFGLSYSPYGYYSVPTETIPTADSTSETATGTTKTGGTKSGGAPSAIGNTPGNDGESTGKSGTSAVASDGQAGESNSTAAGGEPPAGANGDEEDDDNISGKDYQNNDVPEDTEKETNNPDTGEHENLVIGSRVTAVGEAATIVEMLGSEGQLVGTSSSFYDNSFAQQVFADKGASEVPVWWDGDGSDPCDDFSALLEAHPDVCFEISGEETFSEAQIAALNNAGIAYTPLPKLNSIANIEEAVTIVGEVLGNHASEGGTDAESIASEYCAWADNVIRLSQAGAGSAKYTAYISRWDSEAYWKIYSPSVDPLKDGYGAPVGMRSATSKPLNECMEYANLTNRGRDNVYVDPVKSVQWLSSITGETAKMDSNSPAFGQNYRLGLENYPAVIVADRSIAEKMLSGDYYEYHWQVGYDVQVSAYTVEFGFTVDGDGGHPIQTYTEDNYWVYVNPSGVGSWTDGSVESPLEAAWLTCKFQNGISESDMQDMVSDFYKEFYGTTENVPSVSEGYYIYR